MSNQYKYKRITAIVKNCYLKNPENVHHVSSMYFTPKKSVTDKI